MQCMRDGRRADQRPGLRTMRPTSAENRPSTRLAMLAALVAAYVGAAHAGPAPSEGALPAPPKRDTLLGGNADLQLELVINGRSSGRIIAVQRVDGDFRVARSDLRLAGLSLDEGVADWVAVNRAEGVVVDYDVALQRLVLTVPAAWLPTQHLRGYGAQERVAAQSSTGALLNYDLYASRPESGRVAVSLGADFRVFGRFGSISSTGAWTDSFNGGERNRRYVRYDTRWSYSDEENMRTYEAGDVVTKGVNWSSPVRLGGLQVSRDFSVRPDVVTYPIPRFSGEAGLPSALDLFINGFKADSQQVAPGPFTLDSAPYVNGAGDAVVLTTDAFGRQTSTTIPFYVSSDLIKPGLSDYSIAVGSLRRSIGRDNFDYGASALTAAYRTGVTDWFTAEASAEAARSFGLVGLGGVLKLRNMGVLSSSFTQSRYEGRAGSRYSVGYQYTSRRFSFSAQQSYSNAGFMELSNYQRGELGMGRRALSASGSISMGQYGALGMGYFDVDARDGSRTRLANLSYSRSAWGGSSIYLSGTREIGGDSWTANLQWIIPLGSQRGLVTASMDRDQTGGSTRRLNYSRSTPTQGGMGWNLGYSDSDRGADYRQADVAWQGQRMTARAGTYGQRGGMTQWGNATGSLVLMDRSAFLTNRVGESFVMVRTGQQGVPVRYENQLIGRTDRAGRLLVPWASSYYPAKYEIDTLGLPVTAMADQVERRIAVKRGAGAIVDLQVRQVSTLTMTLKDELGQLIPVGSRVTTEGGAATYVGWNGLLYLENAGMNPKLTVDIADGPRCRVEIDGTAHEGKTVDVGVVICTRVVSP